MEILLALGKCCLQSTQTMEGGICFYTYMTMLLRAARDEAAWWNLTGQSFCLSSRAASRRVQEELSRNPSPAAFLLAVWSSRMQGCSTLRVCSSPSLTRGCLASCWAQQRAASVPGLCSLAMASCGDSCDPGASACHQRGNPSPYASQSVCLSDKRWGLSSLR